MAFTGAATVEQISDSVVRISGTLSLAGAASGTIGFADKTVAPEVSLGSCRTGSPARTRRSRTGSRSGSTSRPT